MVHLKIGNYTNKGDGLMLHAIIERLSEKTDLTLLPKVAEYKKRASLGLYQSFWFESLNNPVNQVVTTAFPSFLRKKYGLVAEEDVTAILDASGFAYGDQWGAANVQQVANDVVRWKKQGKKIVLLPQSLGSFEDPKVREQFQRILDHADLIYARDQSSYQYVTGINGPSEKIKQAPDFTGALKGTKSDLYTPGQRQACIIPNHRMIDSTDDQVGPRYLPFLKECFDKFTELDMNPFVLVHERVDYAVAEELERLVGRKIDIVYDDDPLVLRGVISQCYIVLSSRFHGLISTLSQVVPCLGTRWAHKFERVMEEYKCSDYLVSPTDAPEMVGKKIEELNTEVTRKQVMQNINDTVEEHKRRNEQMWSEVEALLGLS
uniref:Polysaccharide pyruvyl transferase family protein n=1 Tax=Roseihalotalea indica TaxID=2867963 RepID=A0AA49GH73_9BACT|nr:polysaccharide pyruvyl transferase family protein [Tunicatimonas sp. TK19036]